MLGSRLSAEAVEGTEAAGSVALLADLIHNVGDAATAIPVGIAFFLRSSRAERWAGMAVVFAIFASAFWQTIDRLIDPKDLSHLWVLAGAGAIGFVGNELAARVRLRAGRRLNSPALIADGNHARVDGFVSLGVIGSALAVALGAQIGDPLIGLAITLVILKITFKARASGGTSLALCGSRSCGRCWGTLPAMRRATHASLLVSLVALATPSVASAHGLHSSSATSIPDYVWLGIRHMVGGWDHLLFITGIVLLARSALLAAKLISVFVAGHSTTLLIATLAGWNFNASAVDVMIALSVAFIGWRVLRGKPERWRPTVLAILGFGLVHGLGLSTRLQELPLPSGGALVARILAFNIGVEIGQLTALIVLVGIGLLATRYVRILRTARPIAGRVLIALGALGAATIAAFAATASDSFTTVPGAGKCIEQPSKLRLDPSQGGHLARRFYLPYELAREEDIQHVLFDGFVVVRYRPGISGAQQQRLASWSYQYVDVFVVPAIRPPYIVVAEHHERTMKCKELNLDALTRFRERMAALPQ